jgi:hypothetical protein
MRWLILSLLLIGGCVSNRFISPDPGYAVWDKVKRRLPVQPEYYRLWRETEQCSKTHKEWGHVKFYVVDMDLTSMPIHGQDVMAYWDSGDDSITLLERYVHDDVIVKHEMLHSITGELKHPLVLFRDACNAMPN